ncbi:hypothetical protein [Argonema galeatum]|nr:hypothetical protein [Argonema galeatum]MCL1463330.1 hypothetical protein [Argonema galeatum A003/A1]
MSASSFGMGRGKSDRSLGREKGGCFIMLLLLRQTGQFAYGISDRS